MDHWRDFLEAVPWFLEPGQVASAKSTEGPGAWRSKTDHFVTLFPALTRLLSVAHVTAVSVGKRSLLLFSWTVNGEIACWLTELAVAAPPKSVCAPHQVLFRSFGGIVERSSEPSSWLLNHNEALTTREASHDASFLKDYAWAFPNSAIPLEPTSFYSAAREANGNTTLCHRETGEIILFAPDHSFDHVHPWHDLPEYTLYQLEGAPDFCSFVETIAKQWLDALD